MSLRIRYGSALSDNAALYKDLIEKASARPDENFVILVPEQASLTVQQEMIRLAENHALFNIDVLTFNRLFYRVFRDLGTPGKNVLRTRGS